MTVTFNLAQFWQGMGLSQFFVEDNWKMLVMIAVACVLLYFAIVKEYEPLLLLPIAFGMLLANLPGAELYHPDFFLDHTVNFRQVMKELRSLE